MLKALFRPSQTTVAGRALFQACSAAARRPAFYAGWDAPDTPQGRFELYMMHVALVLRRLRGEGAQAKDVSQAVFDALIRNLDDGLRDMGVGDLSVGKKMRKLAEAVYGRLKAYDDALAAADPRAAVQAAVTRTLYGELPAGHAADFAGYVLAVAAALDAQPLETLLAGEVAFPEPVAA